MITIESPFLTAGKIYGWPGKPIGLGISMALLEGEGMIEVTVGDSPKVWQIDKAKAKEFIAKYSSIYDARGGTKVGVIAWYEFRPKVEPRKEEEIVLGENVENLMKGFIPRFGNDDDIMIANLSGEIKKIEQFIDKQNARKQELKTISKTLKTKISELSSKKSTLLKMLARRKDELFTN